MTPVLRRLVHGFWRRGTGTSRIRAGSSSASAQARLRQIALGGTAQEVRSSSLSPRSKELFTLETVSKRHTLRSAPPANCTAGNGASVRETQAAATTRRRLSADQSTASGGVLLSLPRLGGGALLNHFHPGQPHFAWPTALLRRHRAIDETTVLRREPVRDGHQALAVRRWSATGEQHYFLTWGRIRIDRANAVFHGAHSRRVA